MGLNVHHPSSVGAGSGPGYCGRGFVIMMRIRPAASNGLEADTPLKLTEDSQDRR